MSVHSAIPLHPHAAPAASAAGGDADDHTCTLWYIQRRFGQTGYSPRRACAFLEGLIADHGFPRPLPRMKSGRVVTGVAAGSRWQRAAVDAWLDDWLPPEAAAARDRAARAAAAHEMDSAAAHLRLVGGNA